MEAMNTPVPAPAPIEPVAWEFRTFVDYAAGPPFKHGGWRLTYDIDAARRHPGGGKWPGFECHPLVRATLAGEPHVQGEPSDERRAVDALLRCIEMWKPGDMPLNVFLCADEVRRTQQEEGKTAARQAEPVAWRVMIGDKWAYFDSDPRDVHDNGKPHFPLYATPAVHEDVRDAAPLYFLQDTRSYVGNCPMWWKLGGGYTTRLDEAQRYTLADAMRQHESRDTDLPWACAEIEPLSRPTVDMQYFPRAIRKQLAALRSQADSQGEHK